MSNRDISILHEYSEAVFRRGVTPMPPVDHRVNWEDHPSLFKIFEEVESFALPSTQPASFRSLADTLDWSCSPHTTTACLTLEALSSTLLYTHGLLTRRQKINWNGNPYKQARSTSYYAYGRGTPAGGGLYPTEIYWVCGSNGPMRPGIYYYDNAHHVMHRLFTGDVTQHIQAAAFEHPTTLNTDQFLLITANFWKNAYKYSSFTYHVIHQDIGALLTSVRLMAAGFGVSLQPVFWFQDEILNQLLGLRSDEESVFTIVPLTTSNEIKKAVKPELPATSAIFVDKPGLQRSKTVRVFPLNLASHLGTFLQGEARPDTREAWQASAGRAQYSGEQIQLPAIAREKLTMSLLTAFQKRHSFSTFSSQISLSQQELALLLYAGNTTCNYASDLKDQETAHFTRQIVFINNVEGIERGAYAYDEQQQCLWTICTEDLRQFLQNAYLLTNYNLAETAAVIAIVGNLSRMLAVYGNRGHRILNTEAGMLVQGLYLASTALELAGGAALGFNHIAINEKLKLNEAQDKTLLFFLLGHERQRVGSLDYRLI